MEPREREKATNPSHLPASLHVHPPHRRSSSFPPCNLTSENQPHNLPHRITPSQNQPLNLPHCNQPSQNQRENHERKHSPTYLPNISPITGTSKPSPPPIFTRYPPAHTSHPSGSPPPNLDPLNFYFQNFTEDWGAKEMFHLFSKFSEVKDVYIPMKRNIQGKRFGFVHFAGLEDIAHFTTCMNNFWIGSHKILVNKAKYGRINNTNVMWKPNTTPYIKRDDRSYADVLQRVRRKVPSDQTSLSKGCLECSVSDEESKWLKCCAVGYTLSPTSLFNMQSKFLEEGLLSCRVRPMGGCAALLTFDNIEQMNTCLDSKRDWLAEHFTSVQPWHFHRTATDRLVWLRVHGVPLHAWMPRFFRFIGNTLGQYIDMDKLTRDKENLEAARILISTSAKETFSQNLKIEINKTIHNLTIIEEPCLGSFSCWANCQLGENQVSDRETLSSPIFKNLSPEPSLHSRRSCSEPMEEGAVDNDSSNHQNKNGNNFLINNRCSSPLIEWDEDGKSIDCSSSNQQYDCQSTADDNAIDMEVAELIRNHGDTAEGGSSLPQDRSYNFLENQKGQKNTDIVPHADDEGRIPTVRKDSLGCDNMLQQSKNN